MLRKKKKNLHFGYISPLWSSFLMVCFGAIFFLFQPYYEGNICVFLSRAKHFALQTKIIILRQIRQKSWGQKKCAIKYSTIEIKIICIPIRNKSYFKQYISSSFKSFEKKRKCFALGDIFFAFAKWVFLVETYFSFALLTPFQWAGFGRSWKWCLIMLDEICLKYNYFWIECISFWSRLCNIWLQFFFWHLKTFLPC